MKFRIVISFLLIILFGAIGSTVSAVQHWIPGTQSNDIPSIIGDSFRDRIYFGNGQTDTIDIIDTHSETVIGHVPVSGRPVAMDISKDRKYLAVADGGITIVDLDTLGTTSIDIGKVVFYVAFDHSGMLYVTTTDSWGSIHKVNPATGSIILSFTPNGPLYQNALVVTNKTGDTLYVGERGLSPASVYKFDVSGATPVFLDEDTHGAIGSNLKQVAVPPNDDFVYLACGAPYEIQEIDATTIDPVGSFPTGAYPCAVAITPGGTTLYGGTSSTYNANLYKFDIQTKALLQTIPLLKHNTNDKLYERGLAINRTGNKIFAVVGDSYPTVDLWQIQVIPSPLPEIEPDNLIDWNGNLVADFGDRGLWYHDGSSWHWLTNNGHVGQMVVWDGKLVVDFGADKGIWFYDTSWHWMTSKSDPNLMISWDNGHTEFLVVDFGSGRKIYTYNGSWNWLIGKDDVNTMAVWDGKLIVDFGAGRGVYNNDGSWHWMTNKDDVNLMTVWDNGSDEVLVVDYGSGRKIYTYNGSWNWLIGKDDVSTMAVWEGKLVVDFGAGRGVYNNDGSWHWMTNKDDIVQMVSWNNGTSNYLAVDFGDGRNFYNYDSAWNWIKNANNVPELLSWDNRLVVDLGPGLGIYNYNGSWHQMKSWSTAE